MKIGLIGTGRIGRFHAKTLLGLDEVDSLVATDVNVASHAELATATPNITAADSVDDLFGAASTASSSPPRPAHTPS